MFSQLMRMKLRQDDYFKEDRYEAEMSFTAQLREYMKITNRNQAKLCDEISVEKTKMSKIINGKLKPNSELMFRLERHSENLLPALNWYRLHQKDTEQELLKNTALKTAQYELVSGIDLGRIG